MEIVERPWGSYQVLYEEAELKIKRITVKPGQMSSYQSHNFRRERWVVIAGKGVCVKDGGYYQLGPEWPGATIEIGQKHRVINSTDNTELIFVEIQEGPYLGEDDIIRYEDNYGRV